MRMRKTVNVEIASNGLILTVTNPNATPGAMPTAPEILVFSDEDGVQKIKDLIAEERA